MVSYNPVCKLYKRLNTYISEAILAGGKSNGKLMFDINTKKLQPNSSIKKTQKNKAIHPL